MRSPRRLLLRAAYLLPGCSIRLRLTVVYTTLFLASGAALLAVTYVLVRQATAGQAVLFKLGPTEEARDFITVSVPSTTSAPTSSAG